MATVVDVHGESGTRLARLARQSAWPAFVLRRLVSTVVIVALLLVATFSLVRLIPGDPTVTVAGLDANPAARAAVREQLGLDRSWLDQLGRYLDALFHGDLGTSFITKQPVAELLGQRLSVSIQLAGMALLVVLVVSVPAGILAGVLTRDDRRRRTEMGFTTVTSIGGAIPEFLMATLLATVFGVWLRLLPVAGMDGWKSLILPAAAVAIRPTLLLARIVRVETLGVLAQDYVRTARGKRLRDTRIYVRHVLPNVITAALALGGVLFAGLVAGAVLVENVFALPGLGTALVTAVVQSDYPVVQGIVMVLGVTVVVVNTIVDLLLGLVDPRTLAKPS
ncbi:peptide/nickel transport system permease protein [Actinophytocola oryzae]|uniref:Peptide/nickel transport system permease protein n=1 Tax=Actinophytocola oryzae TaxID=502181 RepID=A0A4R7W283_9PSEU|nr:peptide/nickel transport system permease protein [Actinophytocola oryzae]